MSNAKKKTVIRKVGNGVGLTLSKDILLELNLQIGSEIEIVADSSTRSLMILPAVPNVEDLFNGVSDLGYDLDEEFQNAVGKEA